MGWLGTPDPNELNDTSLDVTSQSPRNIPVLAFGLLKEASSVASEVPETDTGWDFSQWVKWNDEFVNDPKRAASWIQLAELCRADYWTRLWIAQEICLASRLLLLYGTDSVAWDHIVTLRAILRNWVVPGYVKRVTRPKVDYTNLRIVRKSRPAQLADYTDSKTRSRSQFKLKSLLELSAPCFSSERHDKIYGILGLGESMLSGDLRLIPGSIPINYSQSLFSLYESVMREYEKRYKESALLVGFSELLNKTLLGPVFEKAAFAEMRQERDLVIASGGLSKSHTLTITGKALGMILKVSSLEAFSIVEVDAIETFYQTDKNSVKIMEDSGQPKKGESGYNSNTWTAVLKDIWDEDAVTLHPLLYREDDNSSSHYESSSSRAIKGRSMGLKTFFATNGLIGIAPDGIEEGDVIWKVDWTNTIAVIRPQSGRYAVIGKALIADGTLKRKCSLNLRGASGIRQRRLIAVSSITPCLIIWPATKLGS